MKFNHTMQQALRWGGLCLMLGGGVAFGEPVTVTISGLDARLEQNVRARLTIVHEQNEADPTRLRYVHGLAKAEIIEALEPFGYYRPVIETTLNRQEDLWTADYRIDPGQSLKLSSVDVRLLGEGADTLELQDLLSDYPLKVGDTLNQVEYEKSKSRWQNRMAELGYFDARFVKHEIRVNGESYTADLILYMETGTRYHYSSITFDNTPLDEALLKRFGSLTNGEPYQAASVLELQKNLFNSGYFSQADVKPQLDQRKAGEVPIQVHLGMNHKNRYQAGAGYGVDTGPRLTLGYRNRYINHLGHSFQSTLRLSMIRSELDALYSIPLEDPIKDQLGFIAQLRTEHTEAGKALLEVIGLRRSVVHWGLREALSLDLHRENFDIERTQTALLLMPGASYTWVDTDNTLSVHEGVRMSMAVAGASTALLSDANFLKFLFNAKGIHSFWNDNRLIARAQMGYIITDDFSRIPLTQRFYAGGNSSIRGYRLNEVGPLNSLGQHTGGRYLTVGSLEYERTVYGDWGVALFYDAGAAFDRLGRASAQGAGAGVGLRWRSPFGPVRFDVGLPLVRGIDPFQISFMVGPEL